MRQDAARTIAEQLNRPDTSGAAGFKLGSSIELRNALHRWEDKNDALAVKIREKLSSRTRRQRSLEPQENEEPPICAPVEKRKPTENKYKKKLAAMSPEELAELRERQKAASRQRSEKLLRERMATMTPEELEIFRKQSDRMKQFRRELAERKAKQNYHEHNTQQNIRKDIQETTNQQGGA
jgi:hypothetical protein